MLTTSVVICAYTEERWQDLVDAVDSVCSQRQAADELIVVIDHNPALLERSVDRFGQRAAVIPNRHTRGLSGARNTGIECASGAVIAFLDDDATAEPDWLAALTPHFREDRVLGVGGAIIPFWRTARPEWFPDEFNWVVGCTYRGMPRAVAPVRNLLGANMSIRRAVFDEVGGFRDGIGRVGTKPVGCEETELCIRARQRWPDRYFLHEPAARVHHRVPATRARWRYFQDRCYAEGLSKAQVSKHVGSGDGLASERNHALVTLPLGALEGIADAALGRDPGGVGRAGAIIAGLALATTGYVVGAVSDRLGIAA